MHFDYLTWPNVKIESHSPKKNLQSGWLHVRESAKAIDLSKITALLFFKPSNMPTLLGDFGIRVCSNPENVPSVDLLSF